MTDRPPIPDSDHVVRLVGGSKIPNGIPDGSAFRPRREDNGELSVNWLEFYSSETTKQAQANRVAGAMRAKGMKVGAKARLVELHVKSSRETLAVNGYKINFEHDPLPPEDPSHSVILGLEDDAAADDFNRRIHTSAGL